MTKIEKIEKSKIDILEITRQCADLIIEFAKDDICLSIDISVNHTNGCLYGIIFIKDRKSGNAKNLWSYSFKTKEDFIKAIVEIKNKYVKNRVSDKVKHIAKLKKEIEELSNDK